MALTTVRLEADDEHLSGVVTALDNATRALKLPKQYHVHDEHYERVHKTLFRGRRVFKVGEKAATTNVVFGATGSNVTWSATNAGSWNPPKAA